MSGIKWQPAINWSEPIDWEDNQTGERAHEKYLRERDEREAQK